MQAITLLRHRSTIQRGSGSDRVINGRIHRLVKCRLHLRLRRLPRRRPRSPQHQPRPRQQHQRQLQLYPSNPYGNSYLYANTYCYVYPNANGDIHADTYSYTDSHDWYLRLHR